MKAEALSAEQQAVADRVLDEEEHKRAHLVVALSGAHAYGFPSPDSDLDLKAVHVEPTTRLLGLLRNPASPSRMETVDGIEIDYSSNEIHPVLIGVLQGNGNYIERILGPIPLRVSPDLETLKPLCAAALSRRIFRHYLGFATSQLRAWTTGERTSIKKLLYVLRTALTGAHALETGEIVTDLGALLDERRLGAARALIEAKRAGEQATLAPEKADRWEGEVARAFEALDAANARTCLPEDPPNVGDLNQWLLALRRARF